MLIHKPQGLNCNRLLLVGTGDKPFTALTLSQVFKPLATKFKTLAIKQATVGNSESLEGVDTETAAKFLAQTLTEAEYAFNDFKSTPKKAPTINKLVLAIAEKTNHKTIKQAVATGQAIGEGINLAKHLGDLPGNICTPSYLANKGREFSKDHENITTQVLSEKQLKTLNMGSLLSVSAGSAEEAKLVVMNYQGATKTAKPIVLVGKGVTFDSGGISLKAGSGMDEMKYDMCGAASVFGVLLAAVKCQLKVNLIGIVPAVENMPSSTATKPGDIVTSMSGQTIEVLNTDAEGRLILCDALTYAEKFKPKAIIDIATLTGACVVALGAHATGLFSNDDVLAGELLNAGESAADRAWHMPLWEEYDKQLHSNFADIANIGGSKAGSITAASFLARFTKKQTWAHLDIAGTAWNSGANKGATGRPVGLLFSYLEQQAG